MTAASSNRRTRRLAKTKTAGRSDDGLWFRQNPERCYRFRPINPGDFAALPVVRTPPHPPVLCQWVLVQRLEGGSQRQPIWLAPGTPPPPDDDQLLEALWVQAHKARRQGESRFGTTHVAQTYADLQQLRTGATH